LSIFLPLYRLALFWDHTQENRSLRMERDLVNAAAFFAKESE
jgi:hypothetical protein